MNNEVGPSIGDNSCRAIALDDIAKCCADGRINRQLEGNEIGIGHGWHQKSTTSPIIPIWSVNSGLRGAGVIDVDPAALSLFPRAAAKSSTRFHQLELTPLDGAGCTVHGRE